jgi:coproporphyrinogen III oxidase-like Fe-S oxidoreductase
MENNMQMHDEAKRAVLEQLKQFVNQMDLQNLKGPTEVEAKLELEQPSGEQVAELDPEKVKSFEMGLKKELPMDESSPEPKPEPQEEDESGMLEKLKEQYESL